MYCFYLELLNSLQKQPIVYELYETLVLTPMTPLSKPLGKNASTVLYNCGLFAVGVAGIYIYFYANYFIFIACNLVKTTIRICHIQSSSTQAFKRFDYTPQCCL